MYNKTFSIYVPCQGLEVFKHQFLLKQTLLLFIVKFCKFDVLIHQKK